MSPAIRLRGGETIRVSRLAERDVRTLNSRLNGVAETAESLHDLEFSMPCQIAVIGVLDLGIVRLRLATPRQCRNEAQFFAQCMSCARDALMCADHKERIESAPSVFCFYCRHEGPPEDVFRFESLRGH